MTKYDVNQKNFVILTSHGRTSTSWLSVALNLHLDFFCSHSGFNVAYKELIPNRFNYDKIKSLQKKSPSLSVNQYFDAHMDVIDVPNYVSIHNYQIILHCRYRFSQHYLHGKRLSGEDSTKNIIYNLSRHYGKFGYDLRFIEQDDFSWLAT